MDREILTVNQPILGLWPHLLWECGFLFSIAILCLVAPVLMLVLCPIFRPLRGRGWLWRLVKHVRRFRTAQADRVVLHYSPDLATRWDFTVLLQHFEEELDFLVKEFGFNLRPRVVVYLVSDGRAMVTIFAPGYGGVALGRSNAIVVPDDPSLWEKVRHELAHLFAYRWRRGAPTLLSEGIAVWMQSKKWKTSVHAVARRCGHEQIPAMCQLLDRAGFDSEPHRDYSYVLAGSFTGFVIARYGWERYQRLYTLCTEGTFKRTFERCCGETMETAEALWKRWALRNAVAVE
jgi:hypothetical protein